MKALIKIETICLNPLLLTLDILVVVMSGLLTPVRREGAGGAGGPGGAEGGGAPAGAAASRDVLPLAASIELSLVIIMRVVALPTNDTLSYFPKYSTDILVLLNLIGAIVECVKA